MTRSGAQKGNRGGSKRRPSRMPTPIPRKLAMRTRFEKNVTYTTFAGTQRMKTSSAKRTIALVRKSRASGD